MSMIMKPEKSRKTKMDLRTGHRKICIQKMKLWMTIQEIEGKYEVISIWSQKMEIAGLDGRYFSATILSRN